MGEFGAPGNGLMGQRRSRQWVAESAEASGAGGVLPGKAGFDPSSVPVFPVVRIGLRRSSADAELVEGVVDGEVVAATDRNGARQAVVAAVADRAQQRPGQAVRAKGQDAVDADDGAADVWEMVVTAQGETYDLTQTQARRPRGGTRPRWLLPAASAGVVLVVAVVVAAVVLIGGRSSPRTVAMKPPAPVATQLPVAGPPGWASQAGWSAPVESSGSDPAGQVSTDGQRVFAPGRGSSVAAYAAGSGARVWSAKVDGTVATGPSATVIDGSPVVVAATSSRFYAWSPATGAPLVTAKLPTDGAQVMVGPGGPIVTGEDGGQHVWVVHQRRLVRRVLPAGASPVAAAGNGVVLAASAPGRVWRSGSDHTAGSPRALPGPAKMTFVGVAGATARTVVGVYAPPGGAGAGDVVLRGFARGSWQPLWTSKPVPQAQTSTDSSDASGALRAAPSGHWGIYGSSIVDLDTGKVTGLPDDWQTSTVGDRVAFGTSSGTTVSATRSGLSAASRQALASAGTRAQAGTGATGTESGTTDASAPGAVAGDLALLVARDGHTQHLYAVPASTSEPAAVSSGPAASSAPSSATASGSASPGAPGRGTGSSAGGPR